MTLKRHQTQPILFNGTQSILMILFDFGVYRRVCTGSTEVFHDRRYSTKTIMTCTPE